MNALNSLLKRLCRDAGGVTAIEYGLIAGLISVAIIAELYPKVGDGLM